ncbi:MAG TPA: hypothetical protein VN676_15415 [Steroidobacteraceae bacterium]|nr:hypothetical protein [Steroidobacteraceae bacterium]
MNGTGIRLVPILLLLPMVSYGAGVYIPKMGIRLNDLPDNVTASKLIENLDAHSVTVYFGDATLSILRLQDATPAGATLNDAAYRKALEDNFGDDMRSGFHGEATSIAGNGAWTWSRATHLSPLPVVEYTYVTYVIANEHAYRLRVHDNGPYTPHEPDARPPDVQAALNAIPEITFEPAAAPAPDSARLKIPRMIAGLGDLYYPDAAVRRNQEGVVDVEFSIDGKGHAVDVKETYAAFSDLGKKIPGFLQNATFRVPPDWEANGHRAARFDMEFQFSLGLLAHGCREAPESRVPGASVISLCRSRLPPPR